MEAEGKGGRREWVAHALKQAEAGRPSLLHCIIDIHWGNLLAPL